MSTILAFVLNDVRHDSRVLREAATLAAAGHRVTIVGRTSDPYSAAAESTRTADGVPLLRVPVATGVLRWALLARRPGRLVGAAGEAARRDPLRFGAGVLIAVVAAVPGLAAAIVVGLGAVAVRSIAPLGQAWRGVSWWLAWRAAVMPWARTAASAGLAASPEASIFWAHDLRALPAAITARSAAGRGSIVYDAHEIFPEAGEHARRPPWARRRMAAMERELARQAAALVTVNELLAERLGPALGFADVVVARNCPPRWSPPNGRSSPLRRAAGIADAAPIVLYHGGLAPGRGIATLVAALSEPGLTEAHVVFMGAGPSAGEVRAAAAASGGRIHLLPPVEPEVLLDWVAGADVVVAPIQATTLNHGLSSPNKVFEAIAAGVPVVGSDLPGIRSVIVADPAAPLGAIADPDDPAALAVAIRSILDLPGPAAAVLRARCLAAAHARWNWEIESRGLVDLAASLGDPGEVPGPQAQAICFVLASSGEFDARTRRFAVDLAGRGHRVTIIARATDGLPEEAAPAAGVQLVRVACDAPAILGRAARIRLGPVAEAFRILRVILEVRAQGRAIAALAIRPDIVHSMGFLALPPARTLTRRTGARLVYDARDLYVESNNIARLPAPFRWLFGWREGRWARAAARVLTVNESCADYLERRYRLRRPVVVMNGQDPWDPPGPRPERLRERLGLAADRPIALYHGGLMPDRGVDRLIAAAALADLATTEVVIMGQGSMDGRLKELAAASPARDRIHFLAPVPPDELLAWVASADVGVMPNQPATLNERLSTPNKLFECLAAGTPVVSSDFPERRRIIVDGPTGPLGRVCDPTSPAAIAGAIGQIVAAPAPEREALRERCRRAARERYAWPAQLAKALAAYAEVTGRPW